MNTEENFSTILGEKEKEKIRALVEEIGRLNLMEIAFLNDTVRNFFGVKEEIVSVSAPVSKEQVAGAQNMPSNFSVVISSLPEEGLPRFYVAVSKFMVSNGRDDMSVLKVRDLLQQKSRDPILRDIPAEVANKFKESIKKDFNVIVELV